METDGDAGHDGNDWNVPALKAQAALLAITGHLFPFDVTVSRSAWSTASAMKDAKRRSVFLNRAAPSDPRPWKAVLRVEKQRAFVEIKNQSSRPITLAKSPTDVTFTYSGGVSGSGQSPSEMQASDFIIVAPGQSFRVGLDQIPPEEVPAILTSNSKSLDIAYAANGHRFGMKAWLGVISVQMDDKN